MVILFCYTLQTYEKKLEIQGFAFKSEKIDLHL